MDRTHSFVTPWGSLVRYSETEMRQRGERIVTDAFAGFYDRKEADGAERNGMTPEAKRAKRLLSEYWLMTISLVTSDCLRLQPVCDAGRGQKRSFREHEILLHISAPPEEFYGMLEQAFSKCCVIYDH